LTGAEILVYVVVAFGMVSHKGKDYVKMQTQGGSPSLRKGEEHAA